MRPQVFAVDIPPEPENATVAIGLPSGAPYSRHPSGGWFRVGDFVTPPKTWQGVLALEGRVLALDAVRVVITRETSWIELTDPTGSRKLRLWTEGSDDILAFKEGGYGWTLDPAFTRLKSATQTDELERWLATYYDN